VRHRMMARAEAVDPSNTENLENKGIVSPE
jgi:hypothetical protein